MKQQHLRVISGVVPYDAVATFRHSQKSLRTTDMHDPWGAMVPLECRATEPLIMIESTVTVD